jgi:glycosyltransferase involved in cell wall biosynthesis
MDWRTACAAVIPCLNEATSIGPLVTAIRARVPTVFVVNDGSSDATADQAQHAGAFLLNHSATMGKGMALRTGWGRARAAGFQWALTMDGDGQHSPDDIPAFFARADAQPVSMVVGNRMGTATGMPPVRRWVNRWMSYQLSKLTGRYLPDSQCGFRLINLADWARLPVGSAHFEIESDIIFQFALAGLAIDFVPIQVIYKTEQSKIHPWHDTVRWIKWLRQARRARRRF